MKTIGIIGGLAWPSTVAYYEGINRLVADKLGTLHSAKLILIQTDFDQLLQWLLADKWDKIGDALCSLARRLEGAGADFILVACNTMHRVMARIQEQIRVPICHIVDAVSEKIKPMGIRKVGLLGSVVTMRDGYFSDRLAEDRIESLIPGPEDQEFILQALKTELSVDIYTPETRAVFRDIIARLVTRGAEVIILGCTEFGKLIKPEDSPVVIIDTVPVHIELAAKMALS
ncbi:aspartate racemase [Aspergillus steynii IBT 23096]|uniref:Aspartate racemase n=1 Tax=Aspergillus steynii IBT 23096 TaxID=1392250 RepID=A0A2I2GKE1_9EURO|nr:aspartate racemase [Aspergillus steynii IBT 23096]PLB53345.1 aspartate racemase [Aspergillus steynii IBT 23096]